LAAEFCVVCGRTDLPLEDGLCTECFAARNRLVDVDPEARITLCPICGSRKHRDLWQPSRTGTFLGSEDLNPFLRPLPEVGIRKVDWEEVGAEANARIYEGVAKVRFRGSEREIPLALRVKIIGTTCPTCSRKAGHFYTAQIQLRGPDGRLPPGARRLRERLRSAWEAVLPEAKPEWRDALSWAEELPEGWDFFVTDTLAARGLAKLFKLRAGAKVKESATLWGRKDGRDVYRVTVLIRLPLPDRPDEVPDDEEGSEPPTEVGSAPIRSRRLERHA
jgi:nonsense-mediated mRNA decay protein 3